MLGAGAKNFWMVEPEPEIWVPIPQHYFAGQVIFTYNTVQWFSMEQTILEPEPKLFKCWNRRWSWNQKLYMTGAGARARGPEI